MAGPGNSGSGRPSPGALSAAQGSKAPGLKLTVPGTGQLCQKPLLSEPVEGTEKNTSSVRCAERRGQEGVGGRRGSSTRCLRAAQPGEETWTAHLPRGAGGPCVLRQGRRWARGAEGELRTRGAPGTRTRPPVTTAVTRTATAGTGGSCRHIVNSLAGTDCHSPCNSKGGPGRQQTLQGHAAGEPQVRALECRLSAPKSSGSQAAVGTGLGLPQRTRRGNSSVKRALTLASEVRRWGARAAHLQASGVNSWACFLASKTRAPVAPDSCCHDRDSARHWLGAWDREDTSTFISTRGRPGTQGCWSRPARGRGDRLASACSVNGASS